jgi:hypothetical protein
MAVDLVLDLEVAAHALCIDVVGDGRAAQLDRSLQDCLQGGAEAGVFFAGNSGCLTAGTNSSAEERLVGVDVADSVQQGLVEQGCFDRSLAAAK